ncbi:Six-hairpin glycosidase-like protein [Lyophyllum atratum]|nr:Six-hairpin glycosidase-like protein [Lyophyllum atratum]
MLPSIYELLSILANSIKEGLLQTVSNFHQSEPFTTEYLWKTAKMKLGLGSLVVTCCCPDYTTYSQSPHGTPSTGPLALPFMRPDPACRTFNSTAVEKVISDMKSLLKDPDLARLFENTFPNTLDTTVKYFNKTENLAFIITGVSLYLIFSNLLLSAQWLRDTANQFAHYHTLLAVDPQLATLVKGVINNEARYVAEYPYCGAFQPPPESGLRPTHNDWADGVKVNPSYEIDSLCGFLKLSRSYYQATKDASFMNDNWRAAIKQVFRVINEQSQATFDADFNFISYYNWTGGNGALSPQVVNRGNGEPKAYTGLVGTHHRPSDDLSVFAFLTPANAMLSVELTQLADVLDAAKQLPDVSQDAKMWSARVRDAVWKHTVVDNIFAYEVNGFGGRYVMDDANVPVSVRTCFRHVHLLSQTFSKSLLSLPYLGFLDRKDPAYKATRKVLLSAKNPYFAAGKTFSGTGPMSQISAIFGTDDDQEILKSLYAIANNTNGLGLIHESQSIYKSTDYTRPWFAWANSYFAEMILDLADRKPGLILKVNKSYKPGQ